MARIAGSLPRVAITLGDPAGIGPEVVARALRSPAVRAACRPVVYGTPEVYAAAVSLVRDDGAGGGPSGVWADGEVVPEIVPVQGPLPGQFAPGEVAAACGRASFAGLERAAMDVLAGKADALATAPLNKEATAAAGFPDAGHLDFLTRLTGAQETGTVLVAGPLRCLHLTTHRSLAAALGEVRLERVLARLRLGRREMARFGVPDPSIAVCALNPHGGEDGLFGREEIAEIAPAVRAARDEGIDARGPFPADSLLATAARGGYDLVLAMYHDQGHIAVKVHDSAHSYTVAFGLPLVRTSVDHGTAFDIAWQGKADARSMIAAIVAAAEFAAGRWPDPGKLKG
jgi:4-hydroxythreonine-4-phosphate dehydrogenase